MDLRSQDRDGLEQVLNCLVGLCEPGREQMGVVVDDVPLIPANILQLRYGRALLIARKLEFLVLRLDEGVNSSLCAYGCNVQACRLDNVRQQWLRARSVAGTCECR